MEELGSEESQCGKERMSVVPVEVRAVLAAVEVEVTVWPRQYEGLPGKRMIDWEVLSASS